MDGVGLYIGNSIYKGIKRDSLIIVFGCISKLSSVGAVISTRTTKSSTQSTGYIINLKFWILMPKVILLKTYNVSNSNTLPFAWRIEIYFGHGGLFYCTVIQKYIMWQNNNK